MLMPTPPKIRLGKTGLQETNTLAYYENTYITTIKSFITSAPDLNWFNAYFRFGNGTDSRGLLFSLGQEWPML
jgi:hypothetical protein